VDLGAAPSTSTHYKVNEFNIIIDTGFVQESDKELLFGPLTPEDKFIILPKVMRWPQLFRDIGIFKSSSEAMRNGWDKDIPPGWTQIIIGKLRNRIYIWKPSF